MYILFTMFVFLCKVKPWYIKMSLTHQIAFFSSLRFDWALKKCFNTWMSSDDALFDMIPLYLDYGENTFNDRSHNIWYRLINWIVYLFVQKLYLPMIKFERWSCDLRKVEVWILFFCWTLFKFEVTYHSHLKHICIYRFK